MRALARQIFFFPIEKWVKKQHFIAFQTLHTFKAYSGNLSLFLILVLSSFYFFLLLFVVVLLFVLKTPSVLPVPVGGKQGLFFCLMYQYCQCGLGAGFQPGGSARTPREDFHQTNKQTTNSRPRLFFAHHELLVFDTATSISHYHLSSFRIVSGFLLPTVTDSDIATCL